MSNSLLESLWARVSANIGDRIEQAQELLSQALSANTESRASRDAAGPVRVGMNGDLYIYRSASEDRINGTVTYISDTPWPTTLPGVPD